MTKGAFTSEDMKNICVETFNGNLREYLKSQKSITYNNENTENIVMIDEETGDETMIDLAEYLNIHFYTWRKRLVDADTEEDTASMYEHFDSWVKSLNLSLNRTYALVETIDESVLVSEDINSATKNCQITFLCPINQIKHLDYYCAKIRANYLGVPQTMQDRYGNKLTTYILWGILLYDEEPIQTQVGECLVATLNFKLTYVNEASGYANMLIKISLTGGDDYVSIPLTNMTQQAIVANTPLPKANQPFRTGFIGTSISGVRTITYYDYMGITLPSTLRDKFYSFCAISKNGTAISTGNTNNAIYFKIYPDKSDLTTYYDYKEIITDMTLKIVNGDFNVFSLTSKTWGLN